MALTLCSMTFHVLIPILTTSTMQMLLPIIQMRKLRHKLVFSQRYSTKGCHENWNGAAWLQNHCPFLGVWVCPSPHWGIHTSLLNART